METPLRHTLPKKERLCGRSCISDLLSKGRFGSVTDIRYCYKAGNGLGYNRIMISVPKKLFKRAVKRNLLKRRIRESWRLSKHLMAANGMDILFTYSTKEILEFSQICSQIEGIIGKLNKATAKQTEIKDEKSGQD